MPLTPPRPGLAGGRRLLWVLLLALAGARDAQALCVLGCACNVATTSVMFGSYNPLAASAVDSTGKVTVTCGGGAGVGIAYSVALSAGGATVANRQLASGGNRLAYNLYTSNAYTTVWGDGSGGSAPVVGSILLNLLGVAPAQEWPVYGRIPGGQSAVAPGSYADALVVTVTYF